MKTDLTTAGSYAQSQALVKGRATKEMGGGPLPSKLPKEASPDYKLELSSVAGVGLASIPVPSIPSAPSLPAPEIKVGPKKELPQLDEVKLKAKEGTLKRPAIFFIKGLDVFSSPLKSESGYAGLGRIAEAIEGSRIYGWDQKEEVIEEIKNTHRDYPVILVGHSFGGDTAIEIADELDSLQEGFRKVDLLVTLDAVGFSHDIIPQNVKRHLNVFGESDAFLNGGPHVARREEKTSVRNILSALDHTEIDDDREIQYEVVNLIQEILKNGPRQG